MAKTRILIVDDHAMFRDGVRMLLETQGDFEVVGDAGTVSEAIDMSEHTRPDIILMDLCLPDGDGAAASARILARDPQIKIIALTISRDQDSAREMIRVGARGYLNKQSRGQDLLAAIRIIASGGAVIDPSVTSGLLEGYRRLSAPDKPDSSGEFTNRELRMLELLSNGASNRQIAEALCLSVQTIKNVLSELYARLQVNNRTEAVAVALQRHLISR